MPFVSQAQWRKFAAMVKAGTITQKVFDEYAKASPDCDKLPKHVGDKPSVKSAVKLPPLPATAPGLEMKGLHLHTAAGRKRK